MYLLNYVSDNYENRFMNNFITSYNTIRAQTEQICRPLAVEDYVIQAMPDVSPAKWHLAHVTWFFETFLLLPYLKNYQIFNPNYGFLFNSYYESLGHFHERTRRGILSRPTVQEIYQYRQYVDENMQILLQDTNSKLADEIQFALELGLHHEQQHQELLLMDIKYNFANNPLRPIYSSNSASNTELSAAKDITWLSHLGGLHKIGHIGKEFAYDNECPQHSVYLAPFKISNRLITNQEYLQFILDGAYQKSQYWLADGWQLVKKENWQAPLYWEYYDDKWWTMTLSEVCPIELSQPVCHVSYYEADAYARWANARLPTEAEWEISAKVCQQEGNFLEAATLHPQATSEENQATQFFGDAWEWTNSAYAPYPGYVPFAGSFSEYNGKFTCNQFVLRGGSAITPESHIRLTYRNFFYPNQRWAFTGIRLARNL